MRSINPDDELSVRRCVDNLKDVGTTEDDARLLLRSLGLIDDEETQSNDFEGCRILQVQ